jgi:sugar phosphate isomerase/epimerase
VAPVLEEYGCILCWDTFLGARRFAKPSDIAARCGDSQVFGMCYDTSHLAQGALDTLEDFYEYGDITKVFHLSNWSRRKGQHLPLRHREGVIDFRLFVEKSGQDFDGFATLEYRKPYHEHLVQDTLWANEFCC